jgi:hypothetical protein
MTHTNEISKVSLQGAERRSNPKKDEIGTPFGLAMTCKDNIDDPVKSKNWDGKVKSSICKARKT